MRSHLARERRSIMWLSVKRATFGSVIAAFVGLLIVKPVSAVQLLINGDFETGTFTGWTVTKIRRGASFLGAGSSIPRARPRQCPDFQHPVVAAIHTETFTP